MGDDYLYHGTTEFVSVHTKGQYSQNKLDQSGVMTPRDVFPEYYIIRADQFNQVATTPLEEWIDFLKRGYIKDDTTTPGLKEARE